MKRMAILVSLLAVATSLPVGAAPISELDRQEQLQQAREADAARNERLRRSPTTIEGVPPQGTTTAPIVSGGSSFFIRKIQLDGMEPPFSFLQEYVSGK